MTYNLNRIIAKSAILSSVLILTSFGALRAEVHFRDASFAEAKAQAAKEHKLVMIDFYTSWCGWCKTLDKNTYSDDNVGKIADAKFVSLKIDAEKGEGVALAKQYKVTGYPTIVFFSADGKEIDRVVGYEDAPTFARSLQLASDGGSKAILDELQAPNAPKDPKKWLIAADYYAQHGDRAKSLDAFQKVVEYDPNDKLALMEEAIYGIGFLSNDSSQWKTLESATAQFPKREEAQEATMMLIRHDFDTKHPQDADRRIDLWALGHPVDGMIFNFYAWQAAEHSMSLDKADFYAKRSIELASSNTDKAGFMDTKAEILFKRGQNADASKVESDALALLDPAKDKKLYVELTNQKTKFDKASASADAQPTHQSNN